MNLFWFLFAFWVLLNHLPLVQTCQWKSPSGTEWNLSELQKKDYWKVKDDPDSEIFSTAYLFNFCSSVSIKCAEEYSMALEMLQVLDDLTDSCVVMGRTAQYEIQMSSESDQESLKITYSNGDQCKFSSRQSDIGKPRRISFVVQCSETKEEEFTMVSNDGVSVTNCDVLLKINHPAGCPVRIIEVPSHNLLWILVKWAILLLFVYIVLGFIINTKFNNKSGTDALPFKDYLLPLVSSLSTILQGLSSTFSPIARMVRKPLENRKNQSASSTYNHI